jgi:hypothetical protein
MLAGVLDLAGGEVGRTRDPLEAEIWASQFWGLTFGQYLADADIEDVIGGGLIRAAARQPNATNLAVLRALAAVVAEPYASEAGLGAEAMVAAGVPNPPWWRSIGVWRPRAAVLNVDPVDDDGVTVFVEFTGRSGPHTVAVYIDHNLRHVKDMFVGPSLGRIRKSLAGDAGRDVVTSEISLAEAADRIRSGLAATDQYFDAVVSDDFALSRALVMARCRLLPDGPDSFEPPVPPTEDEWRQLDQRFLDSSHAVDLPRSEVVDDVLFQMHDWSSNHVDGEPLRFSAVMVELFCADYVPRKVLDPEVIEQVPAVLRAWIRFMADERSIPKRRLDETLAAVDHWSSVMAEQAADPSTWGPAKLMMAGMDAAGVDPLDPAAMQGFIDDVNQRGGIDVLAADLGLAGGEVIAFPGGQRWADPDPAAGDDFGDDLHDDWDDAAMIAEFVAEQRMAASAVRDALSNLVGAAPPAEQLAASASGLRALLGRRTKVGKALRAGAGFKRLPADDTELVVRAAGALIAMIDDPGLPVHDQAALLTLESGNLAPMVVAAARMGPGTIVDAAWCVTTVRLAGALMPGELDDAELEPDDAAYLETAFALLLPGWRACGLLDDGDRLTELGAWAMPRLLTWAWGVDFDSGQAV